MWPVHSADTPWVQTFVEITLSHTVSEINALYTEIQDGYQKWLESDFCKMSPVDCSYTLQAKNFVKIALSRTISKVSVLTFHAEIQDGRQKWRESDFCKKSPYTLDTLRGENFNEIILSYMVKEIEANLCFSIFGENSK